MSYSVHVFPSATRARAEKHRGPGDFFEDRENLEPFTKAQLARLAKELEGVGFRAGAPTKRGDLSFANHELGATALLTARGLYLTASGEEAIAELLMFGSELTEDGELARFDPQEGKRGSWE